jgi:hypothetical protein
LLAGCSTVVVGTDFTPYHDWPAEAVRSYRFVAAPARQDSPRQRAVEQAARPPLARAGFVEADDGRFEIDVDAEEQRVTRRVVDAWVAPAASVYWGRPGWGWGMGWGYPWGWGAAPMVRDETIHLRSLRLSIRDSAARPPRVVWETAAFSEGFEPGSPPIWSAMLEQVLSDFPGASGVPRRMRSTIDLGDGAAQ